jgi:hypothetical protein
MRRTWNANTQRIATTTPPGAAIWLLPLGLIALSFAIALH